MWRLIVRASTVTHSDRPIVRDKEDDAVAVRNVRDKVERGVQLARRLLEVDHARAHALPVEVLLRRANHSATRTYRLRRVQRADFVAPERLRLDELDDVDELVDVEIVVDEKRVVFGERRSAWRRREI